VANFNEQGDDRLQLKMKLLADRAPLVLKRLLAQSVELG
jgi:hypothetical protein